MPAQRVATGRPQRRPTLADVARTAGFFQALASIVICAIAYTRSLHEALPIYCGVTWHAAIPGRLG